MGKKVKKRFELTPVQNEFITELIQKYSRMIRGIISSTLGKYYSYLAEDCVSELFLLVCEKIAVLENHPCPKAWLIVAARTTALRMIQIHKNDSRKCSLENTDDTAGYSSNIDSVFEDAVYAIWLENKVPEKLVRELTERERVIYIKLYIENKKPKDIAKELNISESTVRNFKKIISDKIKFKIKTKKF